MARIIKGSTEQILVAWLEKKEFDDKISNLVKFEMIVVKTPVVQYELLKFPPWKTDDKMTPLSTIYIKEVAFIWLNCDSGNR